MRVAITTEWLNSFGGAERVLLHLHQMFPDAPVYTTVHEPDGLPESMRGLDVRPSFLQRVPFAKRHYRAFLPVMPLAFEQFDLREYDLVISTSSACAKGVIVAPEAVHICYCYTPPRYLWDLYHDYMRDVRWRALAAPVAHWLRVWDRLSADRVDHFVAISHEVARRISRHYGREAEVIYPPAEVEAFRPTGKPAEEFYLVVSRLVGYKRVDLAIEACKRLERRLIVVGDGPARRRLEAQAGPLVEFRGHVSDAEVAELMGRCRALLFPGLEDFGIAPVEAQAAGRPVVAFGRGGALETVIEGSTGVFFEEQSAEALARAILTLEERSFDPRLCRRNAGRFAADEFRRRLEEAVGRHLAARASVRPAESARLA